ncbi:MAG: YbaK/EbsC family protein [Myxococcota bacterium]
MPPHPRLGMQRRNRATQSVPLHRLIKPVLLEDEQGFVLALVSAAQRVDLDRLGRQLGRRLPPGSRARRRLSPALDDCERGAVPPLGLAYCVPTIYDRGLSSLPEVYFEAGDHDEVVHMTGESFCETLVETEARDVSGGPSESDARDGGVDEPPSRASGEDGRWSESRCGHGASGWERGRSGSSMDSSRRRAPCVG